MQKTLIQFVSVVLFLLLASASSVNPTGVEIGKQAPNFVVTNDGAQVKLQEARGKYVVVTFWSSVDAESRIANLVNDHAAQNNSRIEHISMNYDSSQKVWQQIVKLDNLNSRSQFYGEGNNSKLLKSWKQDNGFTSFLIDPSGVIVAVNPSAEMLSNI